MHQIQQKNMKAKPPKIIIYIRNHEKKALKVVWNIHEKISQMRQLVVSKLKIKKANQILFWKGKQLHDNQNPYFDNNTIVHVVDTNRIYQQEITIFVKNFDKNQEYTFTVKSHMVIKDFQEKMLASVLNDEEEYFLVYTGRSLKSRKNFQQEFIQDQSEILCVSRQRNPKNIKNNSQSTFSIAVQTKDQHINQNKIVKASQAKEESIKNEQKTDKESQYIQSNQEKLNFNKDQKRNKQFEGINKYQKQYNQGDSKKLLNSNYEGVQVIIKQEKIENPAQNTQLDKEIYKNKIVSRQKNEQYKLEEPLEIKINKQQKQNINDSVVMKNELQPRIQLQQEKSKFEIRSNDEKIKDSKFQMNLKTQEQVRQMRKGHNFDQRNEKMLYENTIIVKKYDDGYQIKDLKPKYKNKQGNIRVSLPWDLFNPHETLSQQIKVQLPNQSQTKISEQHEEIYTLKSQEYFEYKFEKSEQSQYLCSKDKQNRENIVQLISKQHSLANNPETTCSEEQLIPKSHVNDRPGYSSMYLLLKSSVDNSNLKHYIPNNMNQRSHQSQEGNLSPPVLNQPHYL